MQHEVRPTIDAIGPRLRAVRQARALTLETVAAQTGLSVSTLSRLETGKRQPSLDALIPLAQAYRVSLDHLIAASATGDPRLHLTPQPLAAGGVVVPLTQYPGRVQVFKHVVAPRPPKLASHEGRAWLYVLAGTLRLIVGNDSYRLTPSETAQFDARTPHWFGPDDDSPVELLHLFGPHGDRPISRLEMQ